MSSILNVISKVTDNFEKGFGESTLMGWVRKYDEQGRLVSVNPNYRTGHINIEEIDYTFVRRGWEVKLWKGSHGYMKSLNDDDDFIEKIDLTPDFVKEYQLKHKTS